MAEPKGSQDALAAEDAIVADLVDHALSPFAALLPAAMAGDVREILRDLFSTHPATTDLLEELKPPPQVSSSGDVPTDEADTAKDSNRARGQGS